VPNGKGPGGPSSKNHKPDNVGNVWCEWCEEFVPVGEYNTEHGSEVCGDGE